MKTLVVVRVVLSAFVGKLGKLWILGHYMHVATPAVRNHTIGAILDGRAVRLIDVNKVATTFICQCIEWAVAKQAVEIIRIVCFVTREVFAIAILEKRKIVAKSDDC